MKKNILISVISICLIGLSCKVENKANNGSNNRMDKDNLDLSNKLMDKSFFSMKAGGCMGPCPVFEFWYLKDSLVLLKSYENLLPKGDYVHALSESEKNKINEMLSLDWGNFNDDYKTTQKDLPTIQFTALLNDNSRKNITMMGIEPKELFNLKEELIGVIKSYDWEKVK